MLPFTEGAIKECSPDLLKEIKTAGKLDDTLMNKVHDFYKGYVNNYLAAKKWVKS